MVIMRILVEEFLCQAVMGRILVLESLLSGVCGRLWSHLVFPGIKWHRYQRTLAL
jgi:hypothetical protein